MATPFVPACWALSKYVVVQAKQKAYKTVCLFACVKEWRGGKRLASTTVIPILRASFPRRGEAEHVNGRRDCERYQGSDELKGYRNGSMEGRRNEAVCLGVKGAMENEAVVKRESVSSRRSSDVSKVSEARGLAPRNLLQGRQNLLTGDEFI